MASFPFYKQLDLMDCGPTCLRMIAKYYGRSYSLQYLRTKSRISREGVSLMGISQAADSIGFQTIGAKFDFQTLATEVPLPCIVHWKQNHFIIVYKISSGKFNLADSFKSSKNKHHKLTNAVIHIADPSQGLLTYSQSDFAKSWIPNGQEKGVGLLFETTTKFFEEPEEGYKSIGFKRLISYINKPRYIRLLFQLFLGLFIGSLLQLTFPILTQAIVDVGIKAKKLDFIYLILCAQILLTAGRTSIDFIRSWILLHISSRVSLSIASEFLSKLMRLPLAFFDSKLFGDIMQRVGDQHRIEGFLTNYSLTIIFSLFNFIIFGGILLFYSRAIFLIFISGTLLYSVWVFFFLDKRRELDFKRFAISADNQSYLVQLIQGMQEVKLANSEPQKRRQWEEIQVRLFKLNIKSLALGQYQQTGAFLLNECKNIIITFFAARAVVNGNFTIGEMLAVQYIVGQLNSPVEQLVGFIQALQDTQISLERLNEIHHMHDEDNSENLEYINEEDKTLIINDLVFSYNIDSVFPVLNIPSLIIPNGKTTAIVGNSGSGKTTLLKLLLKFHVPVSGSIYSGNNNLLNISHKDWRSQCGVVMQEGFIFSDTIVGNIAVGEENPDYTRLAQALIIANVKEFIDSFPLGLNTKVGADGNGISQGQKQRILIARAVYKNPEYLFFDEATSALDTENESIIMANLTQFLEGRTVVIVAHRLSTVRSADQIIVLDKGTIVEIGTHEELTSTKGRYYNLVKNQLELGA